MLVAKPLSVVEHQQHEQDDEVHQHSVQHVREGLLPQRDQLLPRFGFVGQPQALEQQPHPVAQGFMEYPEAQGHQTVDHPEDQRLPGVSAAGEQVNIKHQEAEYPKGEVGSQRVPNSIFPIKQMIRAHGARVVLGQSHSG